MVGGVGYLSVLVRIPLGKGNGVWIEIRCVA